MRRQRWCTHHTRVKTKCTKCRGRAHSDLMMAACMLPPRYLQPTNSPVPMWQDPPLQASTDPNLFAFFSALPIISYPGLGQRYTTLIQSQYRCSHSDAAGCTGSAVILVLPSTLQHTAETNLHTCTFMMEDIQFNSYLLAGTALGTVINILKCKVITSRVFRRI